MRTLRFLDSWVAPILTGEKRDSIRGHTSLREGMMVRAMARDAGVFAHLLVTGVSTIRLADLPAERRERLAKLYRGRESLYRIAFRVIRLLL